MKLTQLFFIIFFQILLALPIVSATHLHGIVYDMSLTKVREAQLTIDTTPMQRQITQDGRYSFEIPMGIYTLTAKSYQDNVLVSSTKEKISIKEEGSYVYDLILFPIISEDIDFEEDIDFSNQLLIEEERTLTDFIIILLSIGFIGLFIYLFFQKKPPALEDFGDADLVKLLNFIKKEKRTTQKEIRKQFPQSEAKISLMITELEEKQLIKKLKKGRGNIILFQKKK